MRQYLKIVEENLVGGDFVVGDIHGDYDLLFSELNKVNFDKNKDRLFSVGDLVDRGPENLKVLKLINEPWFHYVVGNHEDMMVESAFDEDGHYRRMWYSNGGDWWEALTHNQRISAIPLFNKIRKAPLAIQVARGDRVIGIVHASPPSVWDEETVQKQEQILMWDRKFIRLINDAHSIKEIPIEFYLSPLTDLYMGHTPVKVPFHVGNKTKLHWIDTGAFYSGIMTVVEM